MYLHRKMVQEDEKKLGPVAVDWWKTLLDSKDVRPICDTCNDLMKKWQSIHPHHDQKNSESDLRSSKEAAVRILYTFLCP